MDKIATIEEVLVYYDWPEIMVALDKIGTRHLCLLVQADEYEVKYLCSPVSNKRLRDFKMGNVDLRDIYTTPETGELFYSESKDFGSKEIILKNFLYDHSAVDEAWLPAPGFFLALEQIPNVEVVQESCERSRAIIHLSLNPPETAGGQVKIDTNRLAAALSCFQNLLKYSYKKSISGLRPSLRKHYEPPENYETEVFAFSPGSFRLHIQSKLNADMAGYVEIFRAMEKVDEIVSTINNPDGAIEILKQNTGHLISSFKKFLQFVIEENTPLEYSWTTPQHRKPFSAKIKVSEALPIYNLLLEKQELDREIKIFTGRFTGIHVNTGHWSAHCDEDEKEYTGRLDKDSKIDLHGITVSPQRYKLTCEERIEGEIVTGKEKTYLYLMKHEILE